MGVLDSKLANCHLITSFPEIEIPLQHNLANRANGFISETHAGDLFA